jgi:hypothetical protein
MQGGEGSENSQIVTPSLFWQSPAFSPLSMLTSSPRSDPPSPEVQQQDLPPHSPVCGQEDMQGVECEQQENTVQPAVEVAKKRETATRRDVLKRRNEARRKEAECQKEAVQKWNEL